MSSTLPHDDLMRVLAGTPASPWPTINERDAWDEAARSPHGAIIREAALAAAREHARTPAAPLPTLADFLAFSRTGDRQAWEAKADVLGARLDAFTLAAYFTGNETWVEQAADALWAICEMTTWVTPAHERANVPDPDFPYLDLWAAMQAQTLAETLQVLGPALDRLDARIVRRARRELDRRIFDPFLARGDWWWLWKQPGRARLNNWTAVCSGAILAAALAALNDDPDRQARIVARAAWSLDFFKDTFDAAGSLDEGAGYWAFGMSYYTMAAERLHARTAGKMDLFADPIWREIATFPDRVRLYGDTFAAFSDIKPVVQTSPGWLVWLGRRMDVPGLVDWAERLADPAGAGYPSPHRYLPFVLRTLFWMQGTATDAITPAAETRPVSVYLPDVQWLIARSDSSDDALIVAVKGGHNGENHNHNDGGSFVVHFRQEQLLADLGAPTYTRQFFQIETRYENIAARSLGHSVPFVNGQEQQPGGAFAARLLDAGDSRLSLDLSGLYPPEARLTELRRDVVLHRPNEDEKDAFLTLSDAATFTGDGATLALPLMTQDQAVEIIEPGKARVTGRRGSLDVVWNPAQATCRAEEVAVNDPLFTQENGGTGLCRLWFDVIVTDRRGRLDLTFTAG